MRLLVGESLKAGLRVLRTRLVTEKAALDRLAGLEVSIVRRDREHDTQLEVVGVRLHKLRERRLLKIRLGDQHQRVVGVLLERHAHFNLHRGAPCSRGRAPSAALSVETIAGISCTASSRTAGAAPPHARAHRTRASRRASSPRHTRSAAAQGSAAPASRRFTDVRRRGALHAIDDLELDGLALDERLERTLAAGDRAVVHEDIGLAALARDEAEAFGVVEPFDGALLALCHRPILWWGKWSRASRVRRSCPCIRA